MSSFYQSNAQDIQSSLTGGVSLGDNEKLECGNTNDLQVFHDGSNSYVDDAGTGDMHIRGSSAVKIQTYSGGADMITATSGGSVTLYDNGTARLNTSSSGVSVTGGITASGDVTAFSDARLKSHVETLPGDAALKMRGVSFIKDGRVSSGVIAQEIEAVAPELVHESDGFKSVAYANLVGYLIEAIKAQQAQIDDIIKHITKD